MNLFKVNIKSYERGIVLKNGAFYAYLKSGKHYKKLSNDYETFILDIRKPFKVKGYPIEDFVNIDALKDDVTFIDIADSTHVIVYKNKKLYNTLQTGVYGFWNITDQYSYKMLDINQPMIDDVAIQLAIDKNQLGEITMAIDIASYEKGLLFYDKTYQKTLNAGRYYFLKGTKDISVEKVDLRIKELSISGQDIMTSDKVPVRLNFICQYKIKVVEIPILQIENYEHQLYLQLQMIIREYIGELKLDELLDNKKNMADYVFNRLKEVEVRYGAEFVYAGLKDIILPGEIRDIINTVLVAEKKAYANVITRREETASTRSLLNTAKLMDQNQTLYKLKELEYLEKIFDKVGHLTLNGNSNLLEQIGALIKK